MKKLVAVMAGMLVVAGFGAGASAGQDIPRMVTPESQTIGASESFSVTYSQCWAWETVVFEFEGGASEQVPCDGDFNETLAQPQGLKRGPDPIGDASATFTGPAEAGEYTGIAYVIEPNLQGLRSPAAVAPRVGGNLVAQAAPACAGQTGCVPFQVVVQQADTTTSTTTTVAGPTTTASGVASNTNTAAPAALPATGSSRNGNVALIAIVLLAVGGGLVIATRRRTGSGTA